MGSVTHLVNNEQPLAVTVDENSPVYSNVAPQELPNKTSMDFSKHLDDLQLDPVILHEVDRKKSSECKLDNDLTLHDKQNGLLSASRLRLLQDTTMIESALDLDSLDDSSIGTNSQAGLMKVV